MKWLWILLAAFVLVSWYMIPGNDLIAKPFAALGILIDWIDTKLGVKKPTKPSESMQSGYLLN